MDEVHMKTINGTAGTDLIDLQLDIKRYLLSIIHTPEFVQKTELEIAALLMLRDNQH